MKCKTIFLAFFLALSMTQGAFSQKFLKKISKEICDCISQNKEDAETTKIEVLVGGCFIPLMTKYESEIKKAYGMDFFDTGSNTKSYELGLEVGKILVGSCPEYMRLISQQALKNSDVSNVYCETADSLYLLGEYDAALTNYNLAIKSSPQTYQYYNSRGNLYFSQTEYFKAISDYLKAIEIYPGFSLGWFNLSSAKSELGSYSEALGDIKMAIKLDSTYCPAYNKLGLIFNNLEIQDSALYAFQKASDCDTSDAIYAYNAAYMYYEIGNYTEALGYFKDALKRGYDNTIIYSYIGNCYDNLENYGEAISNHTTYILHNDSDYIGYFNRALAYHGQKRYDMALADFNHALSLDSTDADIFMNMAVTLEKSAEYDLAELNYSKAISMNTGSASYYDARSGLYEKMRKFDLALQDSKISLSLYPDDCTVYLTLGRLYKALDDEENAVKSVKKAIEMGCKESE